MPMQSRSLFADRILHIELIYEPIFDASSAATLLRVARTCRAGHHAVAAYTRLAFDVDRLLARFFPDPPFPLRSPSPSEYPPSSPPGSPPAQYSRARAFRSLQARTGTLVSGSCALQFFARTRYPGADLDLYVHARHRREVGRWLLAEGYAFQPTAHQDARFELEVVHGMSTREDGIYSMPGLAAIFTFTRPALAPGVQQQQPQRVVEEVEVGEEGEEAEVLPEEPVVQPRPLKVQIMVVVNTPMEAILAFHSTCVMNVISYEKAYCLFPRATLEKRLSLLSSSYRGRSKRRAAGIVKYLRRGFRMLTELSADEIELDAASAAAATPARYPDPLAYTPFLYGLDTARTILGGAPTPLLSPSGLPLPLSSPRPSTSASSSRSPDIPERKPWPAFRVGWRWVDDSASWVLPLPLTGVTPPPAANPSTRAPAHDPVAVCNWEVRYPAPARGRHDPGAVMHFEVATGRVLRYRYLVTDEALLAFLGRELSARARAEEVKEQAELEDPTFYDGELRELCRDFLQGLAVRRLDCLRL